MEQKDEVKLAFSLVVTTTNISFTGLLFALSPTVGHYTYTREEAQEALQELFVVALSLTRGLHRLSLQEERMRFSKKIIRMERVYSSKLAQIIEHYQSAVDHIRDNFRRGRRTPEGLAFF
ncbi:hypothetical protein ACJJTC_010601 [Scirpophaga incertulas]